LKQPSAMQSAGAAAEELRITAVEPFLLHVPLTAGHIADSMHKLTHWGMPGVTIRTESGLCGYGFSGTHAEREVDRLITDCIGRVYSPLLVGACAHDVLGLWKKLYHFPPAQWVGRAGVTQMALAAVDIALWDLKAKASGLPLWRLLGGCRPEGIAAYNTDGGWLSLTKTQLVDNCRRCVEEEGFDGVKVKVGLPSLDEDMERVEAVRQAVGPRVKLMVDANGRCDLPAAMELGRRFEELGVMWFEEPMWYDDAELHRRLAGAMRTPIALGEQLYSLGAFTAFFRADALHYAQPDATRLGGVTEWWQAADLALAFGAPVAPHIGDMMQVHLQLALAHPACCVLEYIPWALECFKEPARVKDGKFVAPELPGAGTELRVDALDRFGVKLG
jgi:L-alanine-DL-glutamate epimerase-like enolase superfamily enzyme